MFYPDHGDAHEHHERGDLFSMSGLQKSFKVLEFKYEMGLSESLPVFIALLKLIFSYRWKTNYGFV